MDPRHKLPGMTLFGFVKLTPALHFPPSSTLTGHLSPRGEGDFGCTLYLERVRHVVPGEGVPYANTPGGGIPGCCCSCCFLGILIMPKLNPAT